MRQKVGERWTKAQALGQRVNFPYCVMAKVKGSWLVARNRLQVSKGRLCPSLKPVPNKKKMMRGHKDVFFFWIQDIPCSVKSSKWKFPPQSEEEQCKDFSFGKHEDLPGDPAESRSKPSGDHVLRRRREALSQRQSWALLKVRKIERE